MKVLVIARRVDDSVKVLVIVGLRRVDDSVKGLVIVRRVEV